MSEREKLINQLRTLYALHDAAADKHREKHNMPAECGVITRELCKIATLVPKQLAMDITPEDLFGPQSWDDFVKGVV